MVHFKWSQSKCQWINSIYSNMILLVNTLKRYGQKESLVLRKPKCQKVLLLKEVPKKFLSWLASVSNIINSVAIKSRFTTLNHSSKNHLTVLDDLFLSLYSYKSQFLFLLTIKCVSTLFILGFHCIHYF